MSDDGKMMLRQCEGCRLDAYQDEAGVWTIGYGDTGNVKPGDRITMEDAEQRFTRRLGDFEALVLRAVKRPMTVGQMDALTSLCYNIGAGAFGSSTLVKLFNAGDVENAARQFGKWIYVRGGDVVVRRGDRGPEVQDWQEKLKAAGFAISCDGSFGPSTEAATRTYQIKNRLPETGTGLVREKKVSVNLVQRRFWEVVRFLR